MKKAMIILSALTLFLFFAQSASAAEVIFEQPAGTATTSDANAGQQVSIDTSGTSGAPNTLTFNPSTGVVISGASQGTSFALAAHHQNVNGKTGGQQYGMAGDSNQMFFQNISGEAGSGTVKYLVSGDTNAASAFAGWATM